MIPKTESPIRAVTKHTTQRKRRTRKGGASPAEGSDGGGLLRSASGGVGSQKAASAQSLVFLQAEVGPGAREPLQTGP
jgi:hypothetical protein